jgi:hypothetical protein
MEGRAMPVLGGLAGRQLEFVETAIGRPSTEKIFPRRGGFEPGISLPAEKEIIL